MTDASKPDLDRLRAAFDDYTHASLGRLVATSDELREAAKACGWTWGEALARPEERGFLAFARRMLRENS